MHPIPQCHLTAESPRSPLQRDSRISQNVVRRPILIIQHPIQVLKARHERARRSSQTHRNQLNSLTIELFKCLVLICSFQHLKLAEIRIRLLQRMEQNSNITLASIAEEYRRLSNIQTDSRLVQSGGRVSLHIHRGSNARMGE